MAQIRIKMPDNGSYAENLKTTRSSAITEGPHNVLCQLKSR